MLTPPNPVYVTTTTDNLSGPALITFAQVIDSPHPDSLAATYRPEKGGAHAFRFSAVGLFVPKGAFVQFSRPALVTYIANVG